MVLTKINEQINRKKGLSEIRTTPVSKEYGMITRWCQGLCSTKSQNKIFVYLFYLFVYSTRGRDQSRDRWFSVGNTMTGLTWSAET